MEIKVKFHFDGMNTSIFAHSNEEAINILKHYLSMKHNKNKCPACIGE